MRLTASDSQLTSTSDVTIAVDAANTAPQVSAGADQTIQQPTNSVSLNGTTSDDNLPAGSSVSVRWVKVSGAGTVSFTNVNQAATTATFSDAGVYVLRLIASDGDLESRDDIQITVNAQNQAPQVSAGADITVTLPNVATLNGTATDDGFPTGSTLSIQWSKVSGAGDANFANPAQLTTTAAFTAAGSYVLRLTVTDGQASASDDVTVTVNADERQLEFPLTTIRIPVFGDDLDSPSISFSGGLDGHRQTIQETYDIYSRRGFALHCRCQNWHG